MNQIMKESQARMVARSLSSSIQDAGAGGRQAGGVAYRVLRDVCGGVEGGVGQNWLKHTMCCHTHDSMQVHPNPTHDVHPKRLGGRCAIRCQVKVAAC